MIKRVSIILSATFLIVLLIGLFMSRGSGEHEWVRHQRTGQLDDQVSGEFRSDIGSQRASSAHDQLSAMAAAHTVPEIGVQGQEEGAADLSGQRLQDRPPAAVSDAGYRERANLEPEQWDLRQEGVLATEGQALPEGTLIFGRGQPGWRTESQERETIELDGVDAELVFAPPMPADLPELITVPAY
jgi:hypothetical protein